MPTSDSAVPAPRESRDEGTAATCDGSSECKAGRHLHGCYSDDGTNCDHPSEHRPLCGTFGCVTASRFVVARSDGDPSYGSEGGSEESCEQHLVQAVAGMIDGDPDVSAIVSIRWDYD